MAHTLGVTEIVEAKFYCTLSNQVSINVRHYRVVSIVGASVTDQEVAAALTTIFAPLYKTLMGTGARYEGMSIQAIRPVGFEAQFNSGGNGAGSDGDEHLPPSNCGLIKLKTGFAGRAGRGRLYAPFPGENACKTNGICEDAYVLKLEDLGDALTVTRTVTIGGNSAQLAPGIYHRKDNTITFIVDSVARPFFAIQRRRTYLRHGDQLPGK